MPGTAAFRSRGCGPGRPPVPPGQRRRSWADLCRCVGQGYRVGTMCPPRRPRPEADQVRRRIGFPTGSNPMSRTKFSSTGAVRARGAGLRRNDQPAGASRGERHDGGVHQRRRLDDPAPQRWEGQLSRRGRGLAPHRDSAGEGIGRALAHSGQRNRSVVRVRPRPRHPLDSNSGPGIKDYNAFSLDDPAQWAEPRL